MVNYGRDKVHEAVWLLASLLCFLIIRLYDEPFSVWWRRYWLWPVLLLTTGGLLVLVLHRRPVLTLQMMDGRQFEDFVLDWLKRAGFTNLAKTEYFDQGIDITGIKDGWSWGIQVKRSQKPVGVSAVRAAVAGLKTYNCQRPMVITDSTFTRPATSLATANNCLLVDGAMLKAA